MTSFRVSSSMTPPKLRMQVYIGGVLRSDAYCTGVSYGVGGEGSTAQVQLPAQDWDGPRGSLRGRTLRVEAAYAGRASERVFNGYVGGIAGTASAGMMECQAISAFGLADSVYIGTVASGFIARYPQRAIDPEGREAPTGWDVASILEDIFHGDGTPTWRGGGGWLPLGWKNTLRLGQMRALQSVYAQLPLGDIVFERETLKAAIERLLGLVGTVSCRERFSGDIAYLDLFELGDPQAPVRPVTIARRGMPAAGSNALDISHEEALDQTRTRIVAIGDRRRLTLSVSTEHPTAPLRKGWDEALEEEVLTDPELSKGRRGAPADERYTRVFRHFLLPECFRGVEVDKNLAVPTADGSAIPIQVWLVPRTLAYSDGEWTSELSDGPRIIDGTELDLQNGEFRLKEPAINLVSSGEAGDEYEPATVGITFSICGPRLSHDTGVRSGGLPLEGIGSAGLAEVVANDSFGFKQISNANFPLRGEVFDATWIYVGQDVIPDEEEGEGEIVVARWKFFDGAYTLQDDQVPLRRFAEGALREKVGPRHTYNVTTPFYAPGYSLGQRIRIHGEDGWDGGTHQIMSLSHTFGNDHSTTIGTDSSVPMIANEVLAGGGGEQQ